MESLKSNEEVDRLYTFTDWPSDVPVSPSVLARHGFFYTGCDDTVRCFRCLCELGEWRLGDHPLDRHRRTNPDCPLVTNRDRLNAAIRWSSAVQLNVLAQRPVSTLEPDCVRQIIPPINRSRPDELSYEHLRLNSFRLQTFHDWPKKHIVSAPSLAGAGFFYTGNNDRVRCAFCKREFLDWQAGDIPGDEHRRGVPYCDFVVSNFCSPLQLPSQSSRVVSGRQHQADEQVRDYKAL